MQKTDIDWATHSWNPITGCVMGCDYCYARRMAKRLKGRCGYPEDEPFRPTFHLDKLHDPINLHTDKPARIFTVSMGDMFSEGVSWSWVDAIMKVIAESRHNFIILTKRPDRIRELLYNTWLRPALWDRNTTPEEARHVLGMTPVCSSALRNLWLGVSVTEPADYWRIDTLEKCGSIAGAHRFVSFEPLRSLLSEPFSAFDLYKHFDSMFVEWVILGAQTGPGADSNIPSQESIIELNDMCSYLRIPLFMKKNILKYLPGVTMAIQAYPKGLGGEVIYPNVPGRKYGSI